MHHAIARGSWHVRDICSSNLVSMYVCVCPHYRGVQYIRVVDQVSFITGARSLNEEDLCKNLQVIKVPQVDIETIHSKFKLAMTLYDEYEMLLPCVRQGLLLRTRNTGGVVRFQRRSLREGRRW